MNFANEMLKRKNWAVVGVTPNKNKFGYKIFSTLKNNGYNVVGINPKYDEINGEKVYSSLEEAMKDMNIECVSVVVPPSISVSVLEMADNMNIPYIWFQPNTYEQNWIEQVKTNNIKMVYNQCVLVELAAR